MPLYHYTALDAEGKKRKGIIEAQSEREAKVTLRHQGLMLSTIETKETLLSKQNLKGDVLVTFTMQLSQLINAGIPLYESLLVLEEQSRDEPYHRIVLSLCEKIKAGSSLSEAMEGFPLSFDKLYRSLIHAGEAIGGPGPILEKLSLLLQKQMKLKKQISTAMIYPSILAIFCFVVIVLLMGFVVPSIEGIFAGRELNRLTSIVLSVSLFLRTWWIYLFIGFVLAFIAIVYRLRSDKGRAWLEKTVLQIPFLNTLVIQTAISRFCRTMATLLEGGVPIIEALTISSRVMQNFVLEAEIKKAEGKIVEGSSLSREMMRSKWIPKMASRMVAVGEDTGTVAPMMNKIADIYEGELEKSLDRVMAFAQPVILIVMGLVIGVVMLAVLLPLTDINIEGLSK